MSRAFQGTKPFTKRRTHAAATCGMLLTLAGCGEDGAAPVPVDAAVNADAAAEATVKPQPADASVPFDEDAQTSASTGMGTPTGATGTQSGVSSVPTLMPSTPGVAPSMTASGDPSAWVPVESPLEGQAACQERLTATGSGCQYELSCDPDDFLVGCSVATDDTLECYCRRGTEYHAYTLLPGTELESACRSSSSICNGSNAPEFSEPTCDEISDANTSTCIWQQVCTSTAELAEGVLAAMETSPSQTDCTLQADQRSLCHCSATDQRMNVVGADIHDVCAAVAPLCRSEVPVDEAITCSEVTLDADGYGCTSSRSCGRRAALNEAGTVYAVIDELNRGSYCDWLDDGTSSCNCSTEAGAALAGIVAANVVDACLVADEVCHSAELPQASGPLECGSQTANAAGGSCNASAACTQLLTNGTGSLLANAYINAACDPDGSGGWLCVCNGEAADSQPEPIAAPSVVRACLNAIDSCVARGHVEISEYRVVSIAFSELPEVVDAGDSSDSAPGADL